LFTVDASGCYLFWVTSLPPGSHCVITFDLAASFEDEKEAALAYDAAVRRLKPNKAHAYVNFVEPASVDAANVNSAKAFGKREGLPPPGATGQGRGQPAQPVHMMPAGDVHMNAAPVNVWSHGLMPRMPFHHMRGPGPDPMMMTSRQPMIPPQHKGMNSMYEGGHEYDNSMAGGMSSQQQFMPPVGNPRMSGPGQMMLPDLADPWGSDGVMDPNQWFAMRGQHPSMTQAYSSGGMPMMQRMDDIRPPQMGHPAAPRPPMMWDPSMSLMKMPMSHPLPMDNMGGGPLRSHVQSLIQPPLGMETMRSDRQVSSNSAWSSQQGNGNQGIVDVEASSAMMGRGFLMSSPHMWGGNT